MVTYGFDYVLHLIGLCMLYFIFDTSLYNCMVSRYGKWTYLITTVFEIVISFVCTYGLKVVLWDMMSLESYIFYVPVFILLANVGKLIFAYKALKDSSHSNVLACSMSTIAYMIASLGYFCLFVVPYMGTAGVIEAITSRSWVTLMLEPWAMGTIFVLEVLMCIFAYKSCVRVKENLYDFAFHIMFSVSFIYLLFRLTGFAITYFLPYSIKMGLILLDGNFLLLDIFFLSCLIVSYFTKRSKKEIAFRKVKELNRQKAEASAEWVALLGDLAQGYEEYDELEHAAILYNEAINMAKSLLEKNRDVWPCEYLLCKMMFAYAKVQKDSKVYLEYMNAALDLAYQYRAASGEKYSLLIISMYENLEQYYIEIDHQKELEDCRRKMIEEYRRLSKTNPMCYFKEYQDVVKKYNMGSLFLNLD